MKPSSILLNIALLLSPWYLRAQMLDSLKVASVDWVFPGSRGSFTDRDFNELRSELIFGSFLEAPSQNFNWKGQTSSTTIGFEFHVVSKKANWEDHSAILALRKQVMNLEWYSGQDDSVTFELTGKYEYFQIGVGYDYRSIDTKFFKLLSGLRLDLSLPVSGFHTEKTLGESKFFSEEKIGGMVTFVLTFEFRLFRKTYLKLGPSWGLGFYNFDGLQEVIPQSGLLFGFKFGL